MRKNSLILQKHLETTTPESGPHYLRHHREKGSDLGVVVYIKRRFCDRVLSYCIRAYNRCLLREWRIFKRVRDAAAQARNIGKQRKQKCTVIINLLHTILDTRRSKTKYLSSTRYSETEVWGSSELANEGTTCIATQSLFKVDDVRGFRQAF